MMTDTPTPLMNETEAANILHVSLSSLRRWRRLGNGPMFRKFGRTVRYRPADLSDFVASAGRVKTVWI
jgi:predicted site-specific integrase-resolvase